MEPETYRTHQQEQPQWIRDEYRSGRLTGGFFILLGSIFLAGMSGVTIFGYTAWILMALIPVYWIGAAAYREYRKYGRITRRVLAITVVSLLPFAFVGAAMLGFNVSALWPVGLIALGVSFILFGGDWVQPWLK